MKTPIIAIMLCWLPCGFAQDSRLYQETSGSPSETLPQVISKLTPASLIMVETQNLGRQPGHFLGARNDSLFLQADQVKLGLPFAAIDALWTRGRAIKTGAIIGGTAGAIGLGTYLTLLCALGRSETEEDPHVWDCTLVGVLLGGVGGSVLGGTIGAAIPKWHERYRAAIFSTQSQPPQQNKAARLQHSVQRIGSFHLYLGYARNAEPGVSSGSFGGRINLFAKINRHWAVGPEFGYYGKLQGGEIAGPPEENYSNIPEEHLWHANGSVRFTGGKGAIQPFATAGLGYYSWQQNFAAYSIAGGALYQLGSSPHSVEAEARWHQNLQNLAGPSPKFFTLMVGMATAW